MTWLQMDYYYSKLLTLYLFDNSYKLKYLKALFYDGFGDSVVVFWQIKQSLS